MGSSQRTANVITVQHWDGSWTSSGYACFGGDPLRAYAYAPALILDAQGNDIIGCAQSGTVYVRSDDIRNILADAAPSMPPENADLPTLALDADGSPVVAYVGSSGHYVYIRKFSGGS